MKLPLIAALALATTFGAAAQTPASKGNSSSAAQRASTSNADTPSPSATTAAPNYRTSGQRRGGKVDTTPATGPTRASRSSSTTKSAKQGKATGSGNIESMHKNSTATPGGKN